MNKNQRLRGVSIIESNFYTLIFAIVIVVVVQMGIFLAQESQISVARNQLVADARKAFNEVVRQIQNATVLDEMNSSLNLTFSILEFEDADLNEIRIYRDSITETLTVQTNGADLKPLHSSEISTEEFFVERINPAAKVDIYHVRAEFANDYGDTFSLQTSVNFKNV